MAEASGGGPEGSGENRTRLRFEALLAEVAVRFLTQPSEAIDGEIDRALVELTDILDVDRCSLALLSRTGDELRVEHAAARHGFGTLLHEELSAMLPWYAQQIREGRRVQFDAVHELPPEARAERTYVASVGLRSHLALALVGPQGPLGALGMASFAAEHRWSEELISRFELLPRSPTSSTGVPPSGASARRRS